VCICKVGIGPNAVKQRSVNTVAAIIDSSCIPGTSTLETYYSNFNSRQLYAQKCRKCRKIQYWPTGRACMATVPLQEEQDCRIRYAEALRDYSVVL